MMKIGARVRMTRKFRRALRGQGYRKPRWMYYGARKHVREFGRCEGIVEGLVEWSMNPEVAPGPEVNVRWQPSNLRYMYLPEDLEVIRES
jgi:hypothetical protein